MRRCLPVLFVGLVLAGLIVVILVSGRPPKKTSPQPRHAGGTSFTVPSRDPETARSTAQTTTNRAPAESPPAQPPLPRGKQRNAIPLAEPAGMSEDQALRIEQALQVMAPVTAFLDDRKPMEALREARKLLKHPNREVRMAVVQNFIQIGAPAALDLAKMIGDTDAEVGQTAWEAFWRSIEQTDNPILKRDLLAAAMKAGSPSERIQALDELLFLPDDVAFDLMTSAMNDPDKAVAATARKNVATISGETFETPEQAKAWFEARAEALSTNGMQTVTVESPVPRNNGE